MSYTKTLDLADGATEAGADVFGPSLSDCERHYFTCEGDVEVKAKTAGQTSFKALDLVLATADAPKVLYLPDVIAFEFTATGTAKVTVSGR